jgi:hypothetical protein
MRYPKNINMREIFQRVFIIRDRGNKKNITSNV